MRGFYTSHWNINLLSLTRFLSDVPPTALRSEQVSVVATGFTKAAARSVGRIYGKAILISKST
jgi:hypothetical protein